MLAVCNEHRLATEMSKNLAYTLSVGHY